jgi:hypothetical protein
MIRNRASSAVLAMVFGMSAASAAHAAEHRPPPKFPHLFPAEVVPGAVRAAVDRLSRACGYSEMERAGPSEAERRRCEGAESKLLALGSAKLAPVIASLDREDLSGEARAHMYAAVGRLRDLGAVPILVSALEHLATPDGEERRWEAEWLEATLQQLTFAKIGLNPPWVDGGPRPAELAAHEWKAWLSHHATLDAEQLLTERLDADRPHLADPDFWHAYWYASFFAEQAASREEGITALNELAARPGLDPDLKRSANDKLREAKRALRKDKVLKAKSKPKAPVPPSTVLQANV